jgi:prevent-host-death family protein
MRAIGIRSLQQNTARALKQVKRGATVEVTERGRRIAWLVPAAETQTVLESLEAGGRLVRAEGDLLDLGEPLRRSRKAETASRRLARMRQDER